MSQEPIILPERVQQMAALYQQGYSIREIAQQAGCTYHNVWQQLHRYQVIIRTTLPEARNKRAEQIVTLYRQGLTQQQIAWQLGVSQTTVSLSLRVSGASRPRPKKQAENGNRVKKARGRPKGSKRPEGWKPPISPRVQQMAELHRQGHTLRRIGQQLGCSRQNVWDHLHRRGLLRENEATPNP